MADDNHPGRAPARKSPQISKETERKHFLAGLCIAVCMAAVIFFISRIENVESNTGSTTGQHATVSIH